MTYTPCKTHRKTLKVALTILRIIFLFFGLLLNRVNIFNFFHRHI